MGEFEFPTTSIEAISLGLDGMSGSFVVTDANGKDYSLYVQAATLQAPFEALTTSNDEPVLLVDAEQVTLPGVARIVQDAGAIIGRLLVEQDD